MPKETEEVIIAGFGGQGILVMGEILGIACMLDGKHVAWMPEYGPETRGGTANCTVVISSNEIGSTVADMPSSIIVMNQPSLERFLPKIQSDGLVIVNSSLVSLKPQTTEGGCSPAPSEGKSAKIVNVEATTIAQRIGNRQTANLVMLGAYIVQTGIVPMKKVLEALEKWSLENGKEAFLKVNKTALISGTRAVRKV